MPKVGQPQPQPQPPKRHRSTLFSEPILVSLSSFATILGG